MAKKVGSRSETNSSGEADASFDLPSFWNRGKELKRLSRIGLLLQLYLMGIRGMLRTPLSSILTVIVVACSLLMLNLFVVFIENANTYVSNATESVAMSVYLKDDVTEEGRASVERDLNRAEGIARVKYVSKSDALVEFKNALGKDDGLLAGLEEENPLPASFLVFFRPGEEAHAQLREFALRLRQRSEVDDVQLRETTITYMSRVLRVFQYGGLAAVAFTFLMTAFIVGSTVRLALYLNHEEAEVLRLVGAPEWFVKVPFVVEGCVQGAMGAILAVLLGWGVFAGLRVALHTNELVGDAIANLKFLSASALLLVLGSGVLVGLIGSLFALRRSK